MTNDPLREPLLPVTTEIFTLHDLVYRLSLRAQAKVPSSASDRQNNMFARAIQDTIRGLPSKHDWSCYQRKLRFTTSASVSGAYTFDLTGGAEEYLLTLTGGEEWPSDAVYGQVVIGDIVYKLDKRLSATTATLRSDFSLTADSTGTLTWSRPAYRLGRNVARIHYVRNLTTDRQIRYMGSNDFNEAEYNLPGLPTKITLQNNSIAFGSADFVLSPAPTNVEQYELSVTVSPIVPQVIQHTGTDGAITAGQYTFTSAAGGFSARHVGTLLRLSATAAAPVEDEGPFYEWQAFVLEVVNGTTLRLSDTPPSTVSGRGFLLSSPIDIDASSMLSYVEAEAYAQYCRNHDHKSLRDAMQLAQKDLIDSIAQDNKVNRTRSIDMSLDAPWMWLGYEFTADPA